MKRLKISEFLERAKEKHGVKYDYSQIKHLYADTKVTIICNNCHNKFFPTVNNHLKGSGCPICFGNVKLTTEEFVKKAIEKHGDKYNYDKSIYKNAKTEILITCNQCKKDFLQQASSHYKHGCPDCGGSKKKTTEEFIEDAKKVHGDKYNYEKVEYVNDREKVILNCPIEKHGDFFKSPGKHLQGQGCPNRDCVNKKSNLRYEKQYTTDYFIERAKEKHGDIYDYSMVNYKNSKIKVIITCTKCKREFAQVPSSHLLGCGCPNHDCIMNKKAINKITNKK